MNLTQRMTIEPTLTFALTAFEPTNVAKRSRTPPSAAIRRAPIRRLGSPGLTLPVGPREREHADLLSHREDVIVVVNIEHQKGAVLLRERNAFVINQAGVLD